MTWLVASRLHDAEHAEATAAFARLAGRIGEEVHDRVRTFQYGLRGGRGAFVVRPDLDLTGWRDYIASRDLGAEFYGSLGFGYIARVRPEERAAFSARLDRQYGEHIAIHPEPPPGKALHPEQFLIEYIEPLAPNRPALGFDIASEPRRLEAALRAMRTGEGALTEAIELVQVATPQPGFLYLLPVYRKGAPTATEADRVANLRGWVYAPITITGAMAGLDQFTQGLVDLEVFEDGNGTTKLLYDGDDHLRDQAWPVTNAAYAARHFKAERNQPVAGRTWRLVISSKREFERRFEGHVATTASVLGATTTIVLTLILFGLHSSRRRAVVLAERMTHELSERNGELEHARVRLDEALQAKGRFLATLSHELRTPMTAILGFSQFLAEENISPHERVDYAGAIQRNGDHMLALINEVLDASKIEAGMMRVERLDTSVPEIARDVVTVLRPRAEKKGLSLELRWRTRIPVPILTDPMRVRQVLLNLVGNAIKFTERGGICLELAHEARVTGERLLVRVLDTGKGMAPEQMEKLFQPYVQADQTVSRTHGGTGLGLSISKQLAQLLGGDLTAECVVGQGCCFLLDLPCVTSETTGWLEPGELKPAQPTRPRIASKLAGRILVVDDGADTRKLVDLVLRRAGATVATAENGREAVEAVLASHGAGSAFDLVLMDLQMPVLDGIDATRELRSRGVATPILALTASVLAEDRARATAAGCDDFLSKPIDRASLFAACERWLSASSTSPTG